MSATSAEQMRAWRGPALLTYGFRRFFLPVHPGYEISAMPWISAFAGLAIVYGPALAKPKGETAR